MASVSRAWSIVLALVAPAAAIAGCRLSPLVRGGDLEPPAGQRVLVDLWVRPVERRPVPRDAVSAMGEQGVATLVLGAAPKVPTSIVRGELASRTQSTDAPASEAVVKPVDIALDARRLESIYAARGYFHAHTRAWRIVDASGHRARAEFDIAEGTQPRVKEVRFVGLEPDPDAAADAEAERRLAEFARELPAMVPLKRGAMWTEDAYQAGLDAIGRAFRGAGFLYARVTGDNWISKDTDRALVVYTIDHGPLVRALGPPRVLNNHMVDTARALRRAEIKEGDVLDSVRLHDAERRLTDLGVLLSVQLRPLLGVVEATPDGLAAAHAREAVALDLELQEATPWDVSVSVAATLSESEVRFGLPLAFTHRDVASDLWLFQVSAKPAVSLLNLLKAGSPTKPMFAMDSGISLDVPSFFTEYLKLSVGVTYLRDPTEGIQRQEVGAGFAFSSRIAGALSVRGGMTLDYMDYLDRLMVTTHEALASAELRIRNTDLTTWYEASLILDLRDSVIDTRSGFYGVFGARTGGPWSGSASQFEQLQLELRGFVTPPFLSFITFAARAVGGIVFFPSGQGTPPAARFLSGGQNSHRAFDTNHMGDYVCKTADPSGVYVDGACADGATDRNFVGGNYLFEVNGEVRFHFDGFGVVAFLDVGNLWSRSADVDFGNLVIALGAGLRIDTPVGPIRVDAARRVDVRQGSLEFRASLGQAF